MRRHLPALLLILLCALPAAAEDRPPIRFGLTAVILTDRLNTLDTWSRYLSEALEQPVRFVQRRSYHEITRGLLNGELDFAWICGFPFVVHRDRLLLVAVPLNGGEPLYRSYLIVPADDTTTETFTDLAGTVFAYSDPDSNSGYLAPNFQMLQSGIDPETFFRRSFFTWSHQDVIRAVSEGVARAGAVDGYVWDTLAQLDPELTARTRVAWRSPQYGFPPVVARAEQDPILVERLRAALLDMAEHPTGREVLEQLNLDGFSVEGNNLFDSIAVMARAVQR
jgi:phosphonate transport system substrate-binding protein